LKGTVIMVEQASGDGVKTGAECDHPDANAPPLTAEMLAAERDRLTKMTFQERLAAWWRGDGVPGAGMPVLAPGTVAAHPSAP
jgi:hypothetical protein